MKSRDGIKKNVQKMFLGMMLYSLCVGMYSLNAYATEATAADMTQTVSEDTSEQVLNGWQTVNDKKYYYENGVKVTGWKTIGEYRLL